MIIIPSNVMAAPSDPFFSNTVLLLKTVGVGGASNSAFRDDSANNFVPVRNGDVTQGGLSPYVPTGYWSGYFDGTGDYLRAPYSTTIFDWWTSDYTIEAWVSAPSWSSWSYSHVATNQPVMIGNNDPTGTNNYWSFGPRADGTIGLYYYNGGFIMVASTQTLVAGRWNHIAMTKTASGITFFVNGVASATTAVVGTPGSDNGQGLTIGSGNNTSITGSVSNLRIVKGSALYTSNFTPPVEPLTAISGTSLLTLQDNRFRDRSTNNFTLTRNGDVSVQRFAPFGIANTVTTHLASTGSVYLDGVGDHLSVPSSSQFAFGSNDFCIELWAKFDDVGGYGAIDFRPGGGTNGPYPYIGLDSGDLIYFVNGVVAIRSTPLQVGRWYHVAVSRSSGSTKMYLNGVQVGSSYSDSNSYATTGISIGVNNQNNVYRIVGHVSNFRIVNGSPVYTSAFTPPTAPLTAITGTSLLTCQDSVTVTDASTNNFTVTRVGDARASEVSPFKRSSSAFGGSAYFDGNGDYLLLSSNSALLMDADFCVEAWINPTAFSTYPTILGSNASSFSSGNATTFTLTSNGRLAVDNAVNVVTTPNSVMLNAWSHVAVTRSGSTVRLFINGVLSASGTMSQPYTFQTNGTRVGGVGWDGNNSAFTGFISSLRAVKGSAVYTADFTPPSAPVGAVTGTSLLLNFDNAAVTDATGISVLGTGGDAKTSGSTKKFDSPSTVYDGNGDFVYAPRSQSALFAFGTGDFTIELWAYMNAFGGDLYGVEPFGTNGIYPVLRTANNTIIYDANTTSAVITSGTLSTGQWYHVAVCRSNSQTRLFINGIQAGSTYADTNNYLAGANRPAIGAQGYSPTQYRFFNGHVQDLRVTRAARYTSNFTPPTVELPAR